MGSVLRHQPDVVFPRLNAFSYWAFLFAGLFIYSSWFLGGAPNGGRPDGSVLQPPTREGCIYSDHAADLGFVPFSPIMDRHASLTI